MALETPFDGEAENAFRAARRDLARTGGKFLDLLDGPGRGQPAADLPATAAGPTSPLVRVEIIVAGRFDHRGIVQNASGRLRALAPAARFEVRTTIIHEACRHTTDWGDPFGEGDCLKFRRDRIRVRPALRRAVAERAHVLLFADTVEPGAMGWWFLCQNFCHRRLGLHAFAVEPASTATVSILHAAAKRTGSKYGHIRNERDAARIFDDG